MRERTSTGFKYVDWTTFSLYLCMMGIGWFMILSVGNDGPVFQDFLNQPAGKQAIWIGISLCVFLLIFLIKTRIWQVGAIYIYGFSILLLIAVLVVGTDIKGARSWFVFGGFSFQPGELAKFGTALILAYYLAQFNVQLKDPRTLFTVLILLFIPTFLILLQPDAGSALVFSSFFILLFRAGLSHWYYLVGVLMIGAALGGIYFEDPWFVIAGLVAAGLIGITALYPNKWLGITLALGLSGACITWGALGNKTAALIALLLILLASTLRLYKFNLLKIGSLVSVVFLICAGISFASNYGFEKILQPHQQDRINVWFRQGMANAQGASYNLVQSKTAIGSGGLLGKGFRQGTMTKFRHVPEQSTDFIFCTVGEEQGFVGSALLILLFLWLFQRLISIAERQQSLFTRYYAYGFLGILFVHFFVNIGMTIGVMPIIGIPLPFISKGGSSLLGFTIMMAVLLKMDSKRFQMT